MGELLLTGKGIGGAGYCAVNNINIGEVKPIAEQDSERHMS
jgi:hypothetical protein